MDCARTKAHSVGVKDFSDLIGQIASLKVDLCFWEDAVEDAAGLRDSCVKLKITSSITLLQLHNYKGLYRGQR